MRFRRVFAPMLLACLTISAVGQSAELLYVSDPDCGPCQLFDRQIAPIYPKTAEARLAPMRALKHGRPAPPPYSFVGQPRAAPTFVLVEGGRELGRFEGYSSDELFWMNLTVLMHGMDKSVAVGP